MTALTDAQLFHIRAMSGDDCEAGETCGPDDYEVSDAYIQYLYDTFGSTEPLCMSSDPLGSTIVWVLRARVRKASKLYNDNTEGGAGSVSQKYDHLRKELEAAEDECGFGSVITMGTLDLGIDSEPSANGSSLYGDPYSWWRLLS